MLEWRLCGVDFRMSLLLPALVTALLLSQPDGLVLPCVLASLIHEGGHLLAMVGVGVPPRECVLGAFGARIRLDDVLVPYKKNIIISLAGPLANGLTAAILMAAGYRSSAAVHAMLAAVNLLPIASLDGGEVLRCILGCCGLKSPRVILRFCALLVLTPMVLVSGYLFVVSRNPTLLIVGAYLASLIIFSEKCEKSS